MDPIFFADREAFRDWLDANHDSKNVLWVGYYKTAASRSGIGYDESVEESICFGWIDGLINGIDDERYKRRFTPRNPDSQWSTANIERAERMIAMNRMTPAGMALIEAAKDSGAWDSAYRLADDHELPPEFEKALKANPTAWEHFQTYSNTDKHAFIAQVRAAKTPETRQRRIHNAVGLAAKGERAYDENNRSRL